MKHLRNVCLTISITGLVHASINHSIFFGVWNFLLILFWFEVKDAESK